MKKTLSESILYNLKESIDVSAFEVSEKSPYMNVICNLIGCDTSDINECIGYIFNDDEPEDFVVSMSDGKGNLVNINRNKVESFENKKEAINKLFGDGANYNI